MFNTCPRCGEYSDAKEVLTDPDRAVCPFCQHEHRFLSLPMLVVTGASGSGKSTVALELVRSARDVVVLDQDILWTDAFDEPANDYQRFRNICLRTVKNIHQSGKSVVLFGSSIPSQFLSCVERRYVGEINFLALTCDDETLERRLLARPAWRRSGSAENLKRMLDFNRWFRNNASEQGITLVDTTEMTVLQTVAQIQGWIESLS